MRTGTYIQKHVSLLDYNPHPTTTVTHGTINNHPPYPRGPRPGLVNFPVGHDWHQTCRRAPLPGPSRLAPMYPFARLKKKREPHASLQGVERTGT